MADEMRAGRAIIRKSVRTGEMAEAPFCPSRAAFVRQREPSLPLHRMQPQRTRTLVDAGPGCDGVVDQQDPPAVQILAADEGVAQVAPALQEREAFLWGCFPDAFAECRRQPGPADSCRWRRFPAPD